jgi:hypothetical protein
VAGIFFTPIVAIVAFATGDSGTGWAALGMFAFALVYGLLLAFEVVGRSNRDQSS